MTDKGDTGSDGEAWIARLADSRGLRRAYALDPAALAAAVSRAGSALSSLPDDLPAASEPAILFDPLTGSGEASR
jgi:hypothetical protein